MDNANYISINSGICFGRNTEGEYIGLYIPYGNKVYLEFNFGFININCNNQCKMKPQHINDDFPHAEKFCRCVINDRETEIYIKQENILSSFRPIVHKHLATVVFKTVEEMNKWLIDKPIDSIKDIKNGHKSFLVTYVDNGDD